MNDHDAPNFDDLSESSQAPATLPKNYSPPVTIRPGSNYLHANAAESEPPPPKTETESSDKPVISSFIARTPLYSTDDIVLNEKTKEKLDTLVSIIQRHDFLYKTWNLQSVDPNGKCISVNFFGPPGTGKTMCAEALASTFHKKIIDVDYAEIESKYVGETGKNIELAFRTAKESDAILFFDEADSILGKRMSNVTQSTDHAVNTSRAVMLKQLDHFDGIVVFATNLAENFDKAFVRRILSHIEVGLPDPASRERLWQKFLLPTVPGSESLDITQLVAASDAMSGGDMKNAFVKSCALAMLEDHDTPKLQLHHLIESIDQVKKANQEVGGTTQKKDVFTRTLTREEYLQEERAKAQALRNQEDAVPLSPQE